MFYPRGISTRDFREALSALIPTAAPTLSPNLVSRLIGEWQQEHNRWQRRDLSAGARVGIRADGVYLQAPMDTFAEKYGTRYDKAVSRLIKATRRCWPVDRLRSGTPLKI